MKKQQNNGNLELSKNLKPKKKLDECATTKWVVDETFNKCYATNQSFDGGFGNCCSPSWSLDKVFGECCKKLFI
jgi:hypothetical protein